MNERAQCSRHELYSAILLFELVQPLTITGVPEIFFINSVYFILSFSMLGSNALLTRFITIIKDFFSDEQRWELQ